jgi:hypothetical protein
MLVSTRVRRALVLGAAVVGVATLAAPAVAMAAPATTDTSHVKSMQGWGTPNTPPTNNSNCSGAAGAALVNDFTYLDATGNGIQHSTVNGADDSWFTTTFTGRGTVTFYPASSLNVTMDNSGNIVSADVIGPPDMVLSVRLTSWFGFEANRQNAVGHGTLDAQGTSLAGGATVTAGQSVSFHNNSQVSWAVGADPSGPPTSMHNDMHC